MGIHASWQQLHADRLHWLGGVRSRFLSSIQTEEVRQLLAAPQRGATVAVFGKTAAGKTTLILKLLGVAEVADGEVNRLVELGRILRGNKDHYKTGTASAICYRRGGMERFSYEDDTVSMDDLDAEGISQRLQDLRERVERGLAPQRIVQITIPAVYFDQASAEDGLTIVDIPGIGAPEGGEEQRHLEHLTSGIVRAAHLILIVSRADALSQLVVESGDIDQSRTSGMVVPGLGPWDDFRTKVRFVLSFSATLRSVQEALCVPGQTLTAERFREHFAGEFPLPIDREMLYPLEYGESWQAFACRDRNRHREFSRVVQDLVETLRKDIREHSTETAVLYSFLRQESAVHDRLKRGRKTFVCEIVEARRERRRDRDRVAELRMDMECSLGRAQARQKSMDEALLNRKKLRSAGSDFPETPAFDDVERDPRASLLDEVIVEYQSTLACKAGQWAEERGVALGLPLQATHLAPVLTAVRDFGWTGFRGRYLRDRYSLGSWFGSKWSQDMSEAKNTCAGIREVAAQAAKQALTQLLEDLIKLRKSERDEARMRSELAAQLLREAECRLAEAQSRVKRMQQELQGWRRRTREDLASCRKSRDLVEEAWASEQESIFGRLNSPSSDPVQKVLLLAKAYLVDQEVVLRTRGVH